MTSSGKPPAPVTIRWPSSTNRTDAIRLHIAVLNNRPKKIIKYVKRGTLVDAYNNDSQPPIFCAAFLGKANIVKTLLQLGANPNARCYPDGCTPVHGACYIGCTKSLKLLLQAGGDLRLTDNRRRTPMDWTMLQLDEVKRRNIRDVLDSARMCAFKTSGKELLSELEPRIGTFKEKKVTPSLVEQVLATTSCCAGLANLIRESPIVSDVKLNLNMFPMGYGKVYFGNRCEERCGAVIGLPFVNEVSDLKLDEESTSPSWICGKFTTFVPMMWIGKKTSVTVRELRKSTVEDAIPDILIAELDSLVKLHHPCLLMLLAVCHVDNYDSISLVYEKVALGSLHFLLYNQFKRLSSQFVTDIITQVCDALTYIHASGFLHGFVNSHSIFLMDNNRAKLGCLEYISPIGASREAIQSLAHPSLRSDSHLSVYRHWAAPEILTGKRSACIASDIYSLCCVIWELIYGEVPWKDYTLETMKVMLSENPYARLPLDRGVVPQLWYHVLNMGLEPEVPMRDLDLIEVRDMMILSKSRIDNSDSGGGGDALTMNGGVSSCSSRTSLKSFLEEPAPVIKSIDDVDAQDSEKLYQLSLMGPHTAV